MIKKLLLIIPFLLLTESAFACSCAKVSLESAVKGAKYIYIGVIGDNKVDLSAPSFSHFYQQRRRIYSDNPLPVPNLNVSSWVYVLDYVKGRARGSWIQTSMYGSGRMCKVGAPKIGTIAVIAAYRDGIQNISGCSKVSRFFKPTEMDKAAKYVKKLKAIVNKQ